MNEDTLNREELAQLSAWLQNAPAGAPSMEQLADWLAGRLDEAAAIPVESALARDPGLRAALLALREEAAELASAAEVRRARALVPVAQRSHGWRYAMVACLLLAAGGLGWVMGFSAAGDAADRTAVAAADVFGGGSGL